VVISQRFRYLAYTVHDHYFTFQLLSLSYPCQNPVLDVSITQRFTVTKRKAQSSKIELNLCGLWTPVFHFIFPFSNWYL